MLKVNENEYFFCVKWVNLGDMKQEINNSRMLPMSQIAVNNGQMDGVRANPRQIKGEKFDRLKASIERNPEMLALRELLVYEHDGKYIVIGGNMRYRACKELGYTQMPCKIIPPQATAEQLNAYIILDNSGFGDWDWDALANEWDSQQLTDWGVDVPNWDEEASEDEQPSDDDDFDEEKDSIENRVKKGEIWQLGKHRLMCGDSSNQEDVKKLMDGELADMVFTDPPYGVAIGDKNKALNSVQKAGRCTQNIENDTLSADELYPLLVSAMTNCRENCKDEAIYFVTSPQGGDLGLMMMMMKDAGLPVRHMLIWEKNSATFSLGRLDYDYQHEPIFYTWTKKHKNHRKGEFRTTIWKYDKPRKCDLHPTMKPVALVENCLKDGTIKGDIVLDVFGGSGTTIIACERQDRCARLMEIDPHYCDVIIARWEKMTGEKAIKI